MIGRPLPFRPNTRRYQHRASCRQLDFGRHLLLAGTLACARAGRRGLRGMWRRPHSSLGCLPPAPEVVLWPAAPTRPAPHYSGTPSGRCRLMLPSGNDTGSRCRQGWRVVEPARKLTVEFGGVLLQQVTMEEAHVMRDWLEHSDRALVRSAGETEPFWSRPERSQTLRAI